MSSEDLQFEDIVLLQLFKDQIMNYNLDQVKGEAIFLLVEKVIEKVGYDGKGDKASVT